MYPRIVQGSASPGASLTERLRFVRALRGGRARGAPTWAAIETLAGGKTRLVVVERVTRGTDADEYIADWIRDVRRLATLEHPNLARVRDVSIGAEQILVTSDYLDGARWSELIARDPRPTLEVSLRVLVDVLAGLGAMHNLRDAKREPLKLVHGGLTPDNVIVGVDGVARIVVPCRAAAAGLSNEKAGSSYLAPETLLGDESADARADVYGVAAMLWETLTGKALFEGMAVSAIVTQLLSGRVPPATAPAGSEWAAGLADTVKRGLAAEPEKRFESAAAMAAEIRRVAGIRLAPAVRVATFVKTAFGEQIRERRLAIERGEAPPEGTEEESIDVDVRVSLVEPEPPPNATTRPPPPVDGAAPAVHVPAAPAVPVAVTPTSSVKVAPPPPPPAPPRAVPVRRPEAPPPMRARLETLGGVAPQADEGTGAATPVIVPSSHPPPPVAFAESPEAAAAFATAMAMPPAPPVPAELAAPRLEPPADAREPMAGSPVPAMPPMVTPLAPEEDLPPPPPRSRRAILLIPLLLGVLGMGLIAWWLSLSGRHVEADRPPPPSLSVPASRPSPNPVPSIATSATSRATAPTSTAAAVSAAPLPGPTSVPGVGTAEPSPAPPPAQGAATTATPTPPPVAPMPAPPPPRPRPKYEPEGI